MTSTIILYSFFLVLLLVALIGIRYSKGKQTLLSASESVHIKGLAAVIVMIDHLPEAYFNLPSRVVGIFAASGVTLFFLLSAYGLRTSVEKKPGYLRRFWLTRLPAVLIPALTARLLHLVFCWLTGRTFDTLGAALWRFVQISLWVRVLLVLYAVFWLFHFLREMALRSPKWAAFAFLDRRFGGILAADWLICAVVLAMSLVTRLTPFKILSLWSFQSLGFIYGILFFYAFPKLRDALQAHWLPALLAAGAFAGVFGLAYFKYRNVDFLGDWLLHLLFHLGVVAAVVVLDRRVHLGNRLTQALGAISFEIFLIHGDVYQLITWFFPGVSPGVYLWLSMAAVLICAAVLHALNSCLIKALKRPGPAVPRRTEGEGAP